ncbi:MAG: tail fiber protein [Cyanobacteria bacterium J06635_1]
MATPYIGEIRMFAGNFAPKNWALCDGDLLSVSQYDALFSLLGTIYGGDGRTTFGLPDLRGRAPMHYGSGPGLTTRNMGSKGGAATVTLTADQVPAHSHVWYASENTANENTVSGHVLGGNTKVDVYNENTTPTAQMSDLAIAAHSGSGNSQPNMMPYLTINFIICLFGLYPTRH